MGEPGWSRAAEDRTGPGHRWLRRLLPAALLTCVIALYNHFPLTYPDAGNYVENALAIAHGHAPWFFYRPVVYGSLLVPFATPQTIWLIPLAQGLLVAFVVDLTLRAAAVPLSDRGFVTIFAGLSVCTSLPWISGQIMPDVFTGLMILLSFVSGWGDERLSARERWTVGALLTAAIGCHLSNVPLYGMLVIATLAWRMLADRGSGSSRRLLRLALRTTAPLVVATGLVIGSNYYFHRAAVLSRSSALFALAHMVGDSLAQPYLDRVCPTRRYRLCAERGSLRANLDWFLWHPDGTWKRHEPEVQGGDSTFLREAPAIVAGTLRQEWPAAIRASLRTTIVQLGTFGSDARDFAFSRSVAKAMARLGPGTLRAYMGSRQVRNSLPLEAASRLQFAVVVISVLVLLGSFQALRGHAFAPLRALIAAVFLGVALNALIIGCLAMVQPRYQSRVVWLVPLMGAIAALQVVRARAFRSP
jgi:hypothetical protein